MSEIDLSTSPTTAPPLPPGLDSVLVRNIDALTRRKREEERQAPLQQKIADGITRFTGSLPFVYLHLALFGGWVLANVGLIPALPKFDPTFVILATWASVEAIFLSTFVLISQNRASQAADRRADLDLQINLLTEHEVTRLISLTQAIADHLGLDAARDPELGELERDVAPEAVLDTLDHAEPERAPKPEAMKQRSGAGLS